MTVLVDGDAPAEATLTATLDDIVLMTDVTVLGAAHMPVVSEVNPPATSILLGTDFGFAVTLDTPAPPDGIDIPVVVGDDMVVSCADDGERRGRHVRSRSAGLGPGRSAARRSTIGGVVVSVEVVDVPPVGVVLSEVFYDADTGSAGDNGLEWVEIYNGTGAPIDLAGYTITWGGTSTTAETMGLSGTIMPGGCFVVGGPTSSADNYSPMLDLATDFSPDIQNSGDTSDVVALFDTTSVSGATPIDAVIYGANNSNDLIDETGMAGEVDVADADKGESIERTSMGWRVQSTPTPNSCSAVLE